MTSVFSGVFWKKDCPNGPDVLMAEECDSKLVLSCIFLLCVCDI